MNTIRTSAGLVALTLLAAVALGQDADETPAPRDPPPAAGEPRPSPAAGQSEADDVFIPTEEIPADEEVTFPVDI